MIIHVRLRDDDNDIEVWYTHQADKSKSVREAIRAYMQRDKRDQEDIIREAVEHELACLPDIVAAAAHEAVKHELECLPNIVATSVQDALANCQIAPSVVEQSQGEEDPLLAARLDAQLGEWGNE